MSQPSDKEIIEFANSNQDKIFQLLEEDNNLGLCVVCGEESEYIEPDACNYKCNNCENFSVFGASELLMYVC